MATTPEGAVKKMVKNALKEHQRVVGSIYSFMPVQNGFGAVSLDFLCANKGRFFAIETKAPGKNPTPLQQSTIITMQAAGIRVFIIRNQQGIQELNAWLNGLID